MSWVILSELLWRDSISINIKIKNGGKFMDRSEIKTPFFMVNTKSYLCKEKVLEIAKEAYFIRIKVTFDDCEMYKNEIYVPYSEFW